MVELDVETSSELDVVIIVIDRAQVSGDGCFLDVALTYAEGCTTAVESGRAWAVDYEIRLDRSWTTRAARITGRSAAGASSTTLRADGAGHWQVDGQDAPHLNGCLDLDLESSAMTNALPVHRMGPAVGEPASAPPDRVVEQTYVRVTDDGTRQRYDYTAPAYAFTARLVYDMSGLLLHYAGIAVRAA